MAIYGKTSWGRAHYSGFRRGQRGVESGFADLGAYIEASRTLETDLPAEVLGNLIKDLPAVLQAVDPVDLPASIEAIASVDLPATTVPIPGVDLGAYGGGHPPEDISAYVGTLPPVDLGAELRPTKEGTPEDLGAALTQVGAFVGLPAFMRIATSGLKDLEARIRVIADREKDLPANIHGWVEVDIPAYIKVQFIKDATAIIAGWAREVEFNLPAVIRRADAGSIDMGVDPVRAVVSTHTSDKLPNLDKVSKPFFENRYMVGTKYAGLAFVALEPIFGIFPDLHAEIVVRELTRTNMSAFLRPAFRSTNDLITALNSVSSFVTINKVILELVPLINMNAELVRTGGFLGLKGTIRPSYKGQTGTSDDAGFSFTATSYKFFLGTSRGLFIPPQPGPTLKIETYTNNHPTPDLHATLEGWHVSDFGAYLKEYPYSPISAYVNAWDLVHISHLPAQIGTFNPSDLYAYLNPFGAWYDLNSELIVQGQIGDLAAEVNPSINPLAYSVVTVSTKPFANLGAIINYESYVRCAVTSAVVGLSAFVKPIVTGTAANQLDLTASLISGRIELDLPAEIVGRKRTRVRTLALTFRAKTRDSERIRGSITPVAPTFYDVAASITGLLHEVDLPAEITPIRYSPHDVDFTAVEKVANLDSGDIKDVLVSFRSSVSFYVYDEVTEAVYATDRGTWTIDLRSLIRDEAFFDRSALNRELVISNIQEFYSLDDAIRYALTVLCERQQRSLSATVTALGQITDLGVDMGIIGSDRMSNLTTKLVAVANSPDITAYINTSNQSSGLQGILATATARYAENSISLGGSVSGSIVDDLGAEITAS